MVNGDNHRNSTSDDVESIALGITAEDIRDIAARYDDLDALTEALRDHINSHETAGFASLEDVHGVYDDLELHSIDDKTTVAALYGAGVLANREEIKLAAARRGREHAESDLDQLVELTAEKAGDDR